MNDRIKELSDQASENIRYRIDPHTFKHIDDPSGPYIRVEFNKEKFAELIVRECAGVVSKEVDYHANWCDDKILKHFGIEK